MEVATASCFAGTEVVRLAMEELPQDSDAMAGHYTSLPHCVWHLISLLVYGDGTCPRDVLRTRAALMLISKDVAAATREVPLQLDLRAAGDLAAVKALLAAAPVSRLWLRAGMRGDEILRDPGMRRQSCGSLRELSASISCTDTLQAFRNLQGLHLQADVLPKLYPAVLWGVLGLQRLSLHHYEDFHLTDIPAALVPTIKLLEITPKPAALHSQFALRLPPAMSLLCLTLRGSFHSILSHKAAPRATVDVQAMCWQCQEVVLEAEDILFELPGPSPAPWSGHPSRGGVQGFVDVLLQRHGPGHCPTPWRRLEFWVLGSIALSARPGGGRLAGSTEEVWPLLAPEDFAAEIQHALLGVDDGALSVSVRREQCSIFFPAILLIERA